MLEGSNYRITLARLWQKRVKNYKHIMILLGNRMENGDKNAKSKRYMKQGAWNFHLPFRCDILGIIKRSYNLAKIGTDLH